MSECVCLIWGYPLELFVTWKYNRYNQHMSFIKMHKNICLALGAYILVSLLLFTWAYIIPISTEPNLVKQITLGLLVILIIAGIYFGSKSTKSKESSWAGDLLMVIGILTLLFPLYGQFVILVFGGMLHW
jgi:uncharacterized membrane protein